MAQVTSFKCTRFSKDTRPVPKITDIRLSRCDYLGHQLCYRTPSYQGLCVTCHPKANLASVVNVRLTISFLLFLIALPRFFFPYGLHKSASCVVLFSLVFSRHGHSTFISSLWFDSVTSFSLFLSADLHCWCQSAIWAQWFSTASRFVKLIGLLLLERDWPLLCIVRYRRHIYSVSECCPVKSPAFTKSTHSNSPPILGHFDRFIRRSIILCVFLDVPLGLSLGLVPVEQSSPWNKL